MAFILPPFDAPLQKLNWGHKRAHEFGVAIREHDKAYPLIQKRTATTVIFERERSYPPELALILGDAIHNIRTALDLLAADLACLNKMSAKNVYFPFALNDAKLKEQIKIKNFDRAGPKAVKLLHEIGPHHEGNKALRGLHDLDIMDKHRLILPVLHFFGASKVHLSGPDGELVVDIQGAGDGFSITAKPEDDVRMESLQFAVLFDETAPKVFLGKEIFQTLESLVQNVGSIIELFRRLCLGDSVDKAAASPIVDGGAVKGA